MESPSPASDEFAVGDPIRSAIGRAVLASMLLGVVFVAFTWTAKQLPGLYVHEPWKDDPYDALVSATIVCVPLLMGLCALRVRLCRRAEALPRRRALDLLRASRVLLGAMSFTLAGEWVSVAAQAHRGAWTGLTATLIGAVALLTVLTVWTGWLTRSAAHGLSGVPVEPSQPDWLADLTTLGLREAASLGPWHDTAVACVGWLDHHLVARIRRHPLWAAGVSSLPLGAVVDGPQVIEEGYTPSLALFFLGVTACSLFAFLVIAGAYLGVIGVRSAPPSRAARALVIACASVPLTVAFRGSLWWVLGTADRDAGLAQLTLLILIVAVATCALVIAGEPPARHAARLAGRRRRRHSRMRR